MVKINPVSENASEKNLTEESISDSLHKLDQESKFYQMYPKLNRYITGLSFILLIVSVLVMKMNFSLLNIPNYLLGYFLIVMAVIIYFVARFLGVFVRFKKKTFRKYD